MPHPSSPAPWLSVPPPKAYQRTSPGASRAHPRCKYDRICGGHPAQPREPLLSLFYTRQRRLKHLSESAANRHASVCKAARSKQALPIYANSKKPVERECVWFFSILPLPPPARCPLPQHASKGCTTVILRLAGAKNLHRVRTARFITGLREKENKGHFLLC